ncbi:putative signal peptide protein [Puccinia sorghi]|uniref:Putative signal peptide protein n=1 Tax=Puccinia sorghi TaxID=27349 RepID=A0A0L6VNU4_9BASI|nr:putative signal peptide protein [Puccinia sorghi]
MGCPARVLSSQLILGVGSLILLPTDVERDEQTATVGGILLKKKKLKRHDTATTAIPPSSCKCSECVSVEKLTGHNLWEYPIYNGMSSSYYMTYQNIHRVFLFYFPYCVYAYHMTNCLVTQASADNRSGRDPQTRCDCAFFIFFRPSSLVIPPDFNIAKSLSTGIYIHLTPTRYNHTNIYIHSLIYSFALLRTPPPHPPSSPPNCTPLCPFSQLPSKKRPQSFPVSPLFFLLFFFSSPSALPASTATLQPSGSRTAHTLSLVQDLLSPPSPPCLPPEDPPILTCNPMGGISLPQHHGSSPQVIIACQQSLICDNLSYIEGERTSRGDGCRRSDVQAIAGAIRQTLRERYPANPLSSRAQSGLLSLCLSLIPRHQRLLVPIPTPKLVAHYTRSEGTLASLKDPLVLLGVSLTLAYPDCPLPRSYYTAFLLADLQDGSTFLVLVLPFYPSMYSTCRVSGLTNKYTIAAVSTVAASSPLATAAVFIYPSPSTDSTHQSTCALITTILHTQTELDPLPGLRVNPTAHVATVPLPRDQLNMIPMPHSPIHVDHECSPEGMDSQRALPLSPSDHFTTHLLPSALRSPSMI